MVDVTEGGNAILNFTASGLTIFYKMHCEKQTKITLTVIGQYCGPADNCSTSSRTPEVSIETGRLIVQNVTYNRCYSAKTIRGHREIFYNVTVKSEYVLHVLQTVANDTFFVCFGVQMGCREVQPIVL